MKLQVKTIDRNWSKPQERSTKAISFSLAEKPKSEIYLAEDKEYDRSFDYHIILGEELTDTELEFLTMAVISFLQPTYYLMTCGDSYYQKQRLTKLFTFSPSLEETQYLRVLPDSKDGHGESYKIFRKL